VRLKSVSALTLVIAGLALIAFETSIYGAAPVAAEPSSTGRAASARQAKPAIHEALLRSAAAKPAAS
jgi:hypothetical protein